MNTIKLMALLLVLASVSCFFPKNCKTFNPKNFSQCDVCASGYYLDKGACLPCAAAKTSVPSCSAPTQTPTKAVVTDAKKDMGTLGTIALPSNAADPSNVSNTSSSPDPPPSNASGVTTLNTTNTTTMNTAAPNATISNTTLNSSNNTTSNNSANSPANTVTNSANSVNTTKEEAKGSNSKSKNLTDVIFAYLPPHCNQFKVLAGIVCSGCEAKYVLTPNNTCELPKQQSKPKIPPTLLVSSSLPNTQAIQPFVPIIPNLNPNPPQVAFVPIVSNTPTTTNEMAQTTLPTAVVTVATTKQQMPSRIVLVDHNCFEKNPKFSFNKAVSLENARCKSCYRSYYYELSTQRCQPCNPLCKTADSQNNCLSCYMGYVVLSGKCIVASQVASAPSPSPSPSSAHFQDPNCRKYRDNSAVCELCSNKFYYDFTQQMCVQVDPSCKTWHEVDGYCTSCYPGYTSGDLDTKCKPVAVESKTTPGDVESLMKFCTRTSVTKVCLACAVRTVLSNGICLPVSDLCNTFNPNFGYCTSCYSGYILNDGVCSQAPAYTNPEDPNCAKFVSGTCESCNANYFVGDGGVCQLVSSLCNGYNPSNGYCLDCIPLYVLGEEGECFYLP